MPEIEGHVFAPYVHQEWPKYVQRSDGTHRIANSAEEIETFLAGDSHAMDIYLRDEKVKAAHALDEARAEHAIADLREQAEKARAQRAAEYAAMHAPPADA